MAVDVWDGANKNGRCAHFLCAVPIYGGTDFIQ